MNLPALLGVLAALGLVLGLLAVALRALRRFATGTNGGRGRLPLEVVQRLALGPKQGIAVVRVGDRLLAVSLGEGGVRPLTDLGDAEQALLAAGDRATPRPAVAARATLATALRALAPAADLLSAARDAVRQTRAGSAAPAAAPIATAPIATANEATIGAAAAPSVIDPLPATSFDVTDAAARLRLVTPVPATARITTPVLSPIVVRTSDAGEATPRATPVRRALLLSPLPGVPVVPEHPVTIATPTVERVASAAPIEPALPASAEGDAEADPARAARERHDFEVLLALAMRGRRVAAAAVFAAAFALPGIAQAQAVGTPPTTTTIPATTTPPDAGTPAITVPPVNAAAVVPVLPTQPIVAPGAATRSASPLRATGPAPLPGVVGRRPQDTRVPPPPPRPQRVAVPGTPAPGVQPPAIARIDTLTGRTLPQLDLRVGGEGEQGLRLSGTVGVVVMMGLLTLLPTLVLMMTGFTRILIVLHFLRQALGTQSAPPGHLVAGLAMLLTAFVMAPTLKEVNEKAVTPWLAGEMEQTEMLKTGVQPFRAFMLEQTRDSDIRAFLDMSETPEPPTVDDVPLVVLVSAFVISELRTAFQIGFALFLPFIVIDVVVSSVLMSMGMFMLPPAMISLPFKLLLFVLVDGWALLTQSLVQSFR